MVQPTDRDEINGAYAELLKFLKKDRGIDWSAFDGLPWSPDTKNDVARRCNRLASLNLAEYLFAAEPGVQNFSESAFWFATATTMSDFGSANLKQAATRFAEAVSRLPDNQKEPLVALVKRIVPEALTGQ